jgi:hypothetical protein
VRDGAHEGAAEAFTAAAGRATNERERELLHRRAAENRRLAGR